MRGMGSDRIRSVTDAAEWFAQAAREAEASGNHGRAAAFFKAALAVLGGQPLEEVRASLERASILVPMSGSDTPVDEAEMTRAGDGSGSGDPRE